MTCVPEEAALGVYISLARKERQSRYSKAEFIKQCKAKYLRNHFISMPFLHSFSFTRNDACFKQGQNCQGSGRAAVPAHPQCIRHFSCIGGSKCGVCSSVPRYRCQLASCPVPVLAYSKTGCACKLLIESNQSPWNNSGRCRLVWAKCEMLFQQPGVGALGTYQVPWDLLAKTNFIFTIPAVLPPALPGKADLN